MNLHLCGPELTISIEGMKDDFGPTRRVVCQFVCIKIKNKLQLQTNYEKKTRIIY